MLSALALQVGNAAAPAAANTKAPHHTLAGLRLATASHTTVLARGKLTVIVTVSRRSTVVLRVTARGRRSPVIAHRRVLHLRRAGSAAVSLRLTRVGRARLSADLGFCRATRLRLLARVLDRSAASPRRPARSRMRRRAAIPPDPLCSSVGGGVGGSPKPTFLSVGPASGPAGLHQIVDGRDRVVLLKGVNANGLIDYYRPGPAPPVPVSDPPYPIDRASYAGGACPTDLGSQAGVALCERDLGQMAALGYDVIRLAVSWSQLEPSPGSINASYLDRIAQVVGWAKQRRIYVLIDLHQDAWSKYVYTSSTDSCTTPFQSTGGFDGAPSWASAHSSPACALHGVRELDPAVQEDFQKLWVNAPAADGVGLQDHYAAVMVALARRFWGEPTVAGYELINEPSPGYVAAPGAAETTELFPFYAKVISTVVGALPGFRQLFFIEPSVERDVTDASAIATPWSAYSSYRNVVYAPHIYTGVFTADQQVASQRFFPDDGGYRSAISDAQNLGLPLWVGEFGNDPNDDATILKRSYELQDTYGLGGAMWVWKENGRWGVFGPPYDPGGLAVPSRVKYSSRGFAIYTAGTLRSSSYDPDHATLQLAAASGQVQSGDRSAATVVFLPAAASGNVFAQGAGLAVVDTGAGRFIYAFPFGGSYRVCVRAPGDARPGCP